MPIVLYGGSMVFTALFPVRMILATPLPSVKEVDLVQVNPETFIQFARSRKSDRWQLLTEDELRVVVIMRGKERGLADVDLPCLRGMRHYHDTYPNLPPSLLSQMVRIDFEDGMNVCSCGVIHPYDDIL